MKKTEIKSLRLNKKAISNLHLDDLKGGKKGPIPTLVGYSCNIICDTTY